MRPITPQPGFSENDLKELLKSRQFVYVDCYTIINKDGQIVRCSSAQKSTIIKLPVNGEGSEVEYPVNGLSITGLLLMAGVGADVDEQEITLDYPSTYTYASQPFGQALLTGRFDGGVIRRDRYFAPDFKSEWVGGVPMFVGRTSSPDNIGRSSATIRVKSETVLLDLPMPSNVFGPQCKHIVFDPGCGLEKALYATAGVSGDGGTSTSIVWPGGTSEFNGGTVHVEDGSGVLYIRTIRVYEDGKLKFYEPLPMSVGEGVRFTAYPGCDRTRERCLQFGNEDNWRAYPFVPIPEAAY